MTLAGSKTHIHGVLKSSSEDFIVEEIPLYEPCGEGEHLYLHVQKTNMSHEHLIRHIATYFGVKKRHIGSAGRKDLKAITSQWVSVHLPGQTVAVPDSIDGIKICTHSWHKNKLRAGHLMGNKFTLRLREVLKENFDCLEQRLQALQRNGLPNAFGPQRFGNKNDNQFVGQYIITKEWDKVIAVLLTGTDRHHELADAGKFQNALDAWPFGQPAQRNILEALAREKSAEQACKTIPHTLSKLCVNAFQALIFNEVLKRRVAANSFNTIVEGDLVWKLDGGGRTFEIDLEEVGSPEIVERSMQFLISPSGPLWGSKMRHPSADIERMEQEVLDGFGVTEEHLIGMKKFAEGARRPLCVPLKNTAISLEKECVNVQFDLPAGSYATVVVEALLTGVL